MLSVPPRTFTPGVVVINGKTNDTDRVAAVFFDGWELRRAPRELLRDGQRVRLQDQPLQILEELLSHPGRLVTREQLIARLWPSGVIDFDGGLNTAMRKLRSALDDAAEAPRYIETIPRQGYRFIGTLEVAVEPPPATLGKAPNASPIANGGPVSRSRWSWLPWMAVTAVSAMGIASAVAVLRQQPPSARYAAPSPSTQPRVAVLPFANFSPDPANAFFTDGLHDEILSTLASYAPSLEVISRTTMTVYRDNPKAVAAIARDLGVTHVLEGSVRREGSDVRVTLQLIDARSDTRLWSRTYDRPLLNAMTLEADVASEVAAQLAVELAGGERLRPSANPAAYDLYLQAKLATRSFAGRASLRRILEAEALLDHAIALDPSFAGAYLEHSRLLLRKFDSSYDLGEANLKALQRDLEKVGELAGGLALVSTTRASFAQIVDRDPTRALALIDVPRVLASKDIAVLMDRAGIFSRAGMIDRALPLYREAAMLDPENGELFRAWHALLWNARRPAEALEVMRMFHEAKSAHVAFAFSFTGETAALDERITPINDSIDPGSSLMARANRLRLQGRLVEAVAAIEAADVPVIRHDSPSPVTIPAVGRKPVAELHGWTMLLCGDRAAAKRDGRALLDFVAAEPTTKWNAWFLRFLAAEGELFLGNDERAVSEARAALAMAPHGLDTAIDRYAPATTALVFAWAGSKSEAVDLLTSLSSGLPGLGPAEITRDPLYANPLAGDADYARLVARLETEITANRALFAVAP